MKNKFDTLRQRAIDHIDAKLHFAKIALNKFNKQLNDRDILAVQEVDDLERAVEACENQIETFQFMKESVILN